MNEPDISVVITLYNKKRHIERALKSVCSQSVKQIEVIVIDDGSTDGGSEVVNNFIKQYAEDRIILIQQKNSGVSVARNAGIEKARAELIAFLDADDEWFPEFLETIMRLYKKYPKSGLYATSFEIHAHGGIYKPKLVSFPPPPWEGVLSNYFNMANPEDHPFCSSSVAVPKEIFREIGGFLTGVNNAEDLEMWCRIALKFPVVFANLVGAIYYQDADNRISRGTVIKDIMVFKQLQSAIEHSSVYINHASDFNEFIAQHTIMAAASNYFAGDNNTAKYLLSECKTIRHLPRKLWWCLWVRLPRNLYMFVTRLRKYLE